MQSNFFRRALNLQSVLSCKWVVVIGVTVASILIRTIVELMLLLLLLVLRLVVHRTGCTRTAQHVT